MIVFPVDGMTVLQAPDRITAILVALDQVLATRGDTRREAGCGDIMAARIRPPSGYGTHRSCPTDAPRAHPRRGCACVANGAGGTSSHVLPRRYAVQGPVCRSRPCRAARPPWAMRGPAHGATAGGSTQPSPCKPLTRSTRRRSASPRTSSRL